jgi:hypothetical protein
MMEAESGNSPPLRIAWHLARLRDACGGRGIQRSAARTPSGISRCGDRPAAAISTASSGSGPMSGQATAVVPEERDAVKSFESCTSGNTLRLGPAAPQRGDGLAHQWAGRAHLWAGPPLQWPDGPGRWPAVYLACVRLGEPKCKPRPGYHHVLLRSCSY